MEDCRMMDVSAEDIWDLWMKIQEERPVIHCITNVITINDCANILLAAGASPTMAHHPLEAAEVTAGCGSLVCNLGATENFEAMLAAGRRAAELAHPVVLDPVGVAGSSFRRGLCFEFMNQVKPSCIRGNLSEIRALAGNTCTAVGVDAAKEDVLQADNLEKHADFVREFALKSGMLVIASGETDLISDGISVYGVHNGSKMMSRITGSGCMASSLLGAFLAVCRDNLMEAAAASCAVMGICGELAGRKTRELRAGTGTYRTQLIDAVSLLKKSQIKEMLRIEKMNR